MKRTEAFREFRKRDLLSFAKHFDSQFNSATSLRKKRLQKLLKSIDIEYHKEYHYDPYHQGYYEAVIWTSISALLDGPIMLYSLGMNGQALVDLQGILEAFCIREIPIYLSRNDSTLRDTIRHLVERKTLVDLAPLLNNLGVWSDDDVRFTRTINRLRNGVAHKNPKLVKETHFLNIDSALAKIDLVPYIINSISLLYKLFIYRSKIYDLSTDTLK